MGIAETEKPALEKSVGDFNANSLQYLSRPEQVSQRLHICL